MVSPILVKVCLSYLAEEATVACQFLAIAAMNIFKIEEVRSKKFKVVCFFHIKCVNHPKYCEEEPYNVSYNYF